MRFADQDERRSLIHGILAFILPLTFAVKPISAGESTAGTFDPSAFLAETEPLLRPAAPMELHALAGMLDSMGLASAARDVRGDITEPVSPAAMAQSLLRINKFAAVVSLLEHQRESSRLDSRESLLLACALDGQQAPELALRALDGADDWDEADRDAADVLRRLATFHRITGAPATPEANPWNIDLSAVHSLPAERRDDIQKSLPPNLVPGLAQLLRIRPIQGTWWAIMGELMALGGDSVSAQACLQRAIALKYTARPTLEHLRELESQRREQEATLDSTLPAAGQPEGSGWKSLVDRPGAIPILVIGTLVVLGIVALQARVWWSSRTARRDSP